MVREWTRWKGKDRDAELLEIDIMAPLMDGRMLTGAVKWNTKLLEPHWYLHHLKSLDRLSRSGVKWAHQAKLDPPPHARCREPAAAPTSPGTIPFTALTANGGQGGGGAGSATPGVPGQGGQNSTGGDVQMPGNAGIGILGVGKIAVPGINAGGTAGGDGGGVVNGVVTIAQQGQNGKVVFTYIV